MIITLKGADFSASNIGTLSTWRINRSLGTGATYEGPTSVDKGAALSATVTLAENYAVGTAGITITMGTTVLSDAYSISGQIITITIAAVTANVTIKVPTVNTSTGEEEEPDVPDIPTEPDIDDGIKGLKLLNLDFTKNTLKDYVENGVLTVPETILSTTTYSDEGAICNWPDAFVDKTSVIALNTSITLPTNFSIYLKMYIPELKGASTTNGIRGIALANNNNTRPMLNLLDTGVASLNYQSRLLSKAGDQISIAESGIMEQSWNNIRIKYVNQEVSIINMDTNIVMSSAASVERTNNVINHILTLSAAEGYNPRNNTIISHFIITDDDN